jgi:hypothetical protein
MPTCWNDSKAKAAAIKTDWAVFLQSAMLGAPRQGDAT